MDVEETQISTGDDSKVALPEITGRGVEESDSLEKTNMNSGQERNVENDGQLLTLDAIEVKFCSGDNLVEIKKESKEWINGGKTKMDHSANKEIQDEITTRANVDDANQSSREGRVWNRYEDPISLRSAVPQSGYHGGEPDDEDVSAKDLLGFAWQIAKGMVSSHLKTIGNRPPAKHEHIEMNLEKIKELLATLV